MRKPAIVKERSPALMAHGDYIRLAKSNRRVGLTAALSREDLRFADTSSMEDRLDHLNDELVTDKNAAD